MVYRDLTGLCIVVREFLTGTRECTWLVAWAGVLIGRKGRVGEVALLAIPYGSRGVFFGYSRFGEGGSYLIV